MTARKLALAFLLAAAAAVPAEQGAALTGGTVQFQDGAGNEKLTFFPGQAATAYLRDQALATTATSSATWTALGFEVTVGTWWSLATGAPEPAAYELAAGSRYDADNPVLTPLTRQPTTTVNGVNFGGAADFRPATGEFMLLFVVEATSTLEAVFEFDVVDSYPASANRVRVTSTSDVAGEWVSITEVASETDGSSNATSGVLRGSVMLDADSSSLAENDGAVWARVGDTLAVAYYGPAGSVVNDTHHAQVVEPPPVPTLGWHAYLALAATLVVLLLMSGRRTRSIPLLELRLPGGAQAMDDSHDGRPEHRATERQQSDDEQVSGGG